MQIIYSGRACYCSVPTECFRKLVSKLNWKKSIVLVFLFRFYYFSTKSSVPKILNTFRNYYSGNICEIGAGTGPFNYLGCNRYRPRPWITVVKILANITFCKLLFFDFISLLHFLGISAFLKVYADRFLHPSFWR